MQGCSSLCSSLVLQYLLFLRWHRCRNMTTPCAFGLICNHSWVGAGAMGFPLSISARRLCVCTSASYLLAWRRASQRPLMFSLVAAAILVMVTRN